MSGREHGAGRSAGHRKVRRCVAAADRIRGRAQRKAEARVAQLQAIGGRELADAPGLRGRTAARGAASARLSGAGGSALAALAKCERETPRSGRCGPGGMARGNASKAGCAAQEGAAPGRSCSDTRRGLIRAAPLELGFFCTTQDWCQRLNGQSLHSPLQRDKNSHV